MPPTVPTPSIGVEDDATLLRGLPPVADARTRLMVLGSFPGVASLVAGQYYAHPRNQFWPLLSAVLGEDLVALPYPWRLERMLAHGVGLWDVYAHCRREGSLDSAIRDAGVNDLPGLKAVAPGLRAVAHNGAESARTMRHMARLGLAAVRLPSSSPAHAAWGFDRKLAAWREAFEANGIGVAG
jgi:hypoxanthine-DNA glycosylase